MNVLDLADKIEATLYNPGNLPLDLTIHKLAPTDTATSKDITFLTSSKYLEPLHRSKAAAVILQTPLPDCKKIQLIHDHPQLAMADVAHLFCNKSHSFFGQSHLASTHSSTDIHKTATLYPFCYIDKYAKIGANCIIYPHVYIGPHCQVGEHTIIYPNAVIMEQTKIGQRVIIHGGSTIGSDGFGFVPHTKGIKKVPQTGNVIIEDDVEIGALSTIDRATFNSTIIKKGCKLDSQVHIGHNTQVGEHSMLCGQVGIAGSSKIGKRFIAAGQSGVGQGIHITDHVTLASKGGISKDIPHAGSYSGMPANPILSWRKQIVALKQLPNLLNTIKGLKKEIDSLKKRITHVDQK